MSKDNFQFDLFRLVKLDIVDELPFYKQMLVDANIIEVLQAATSPGFDVQSQTEKSTYKWSLRALEKVSGLDENVYRLQFARSILSKETAIVNEDGVATGTSKGIPPEAIFVNMVFYMNRHLIAVEHNSQLMQSDIWRKQFHVILYKAATEMGYSTELKILPVPKKADIIETFNSFTKLTRLKIKLILPNPDLDRYSKKLFDLMKEGDVNQLTQDMKNARGLSTKEGNLPHAAVAMAQNGYKTGDVVMEGEIEGHKTRIVTGNRPVRCTVENVREFVRGSLSAVRTKEAKDVIKSILSECDRAIDDGKTK